MSVCSNIIVLNALDARSFFEQARIWAGLTDEEPEITRDAHYEHLMVYDRQVEVGVMYSPDRAMPDPTLVDDPAASPWYPDRPVYAELLFDTMWGDPRTDILASLFPDHPDSREYLGEHLGLHRLFLEAACEYLESIGREYLISYGHIVPYWKTPEEFLAG